MRRMERLACARSPGLLSYAAIGMTRIGQTRQFFFIIRYTTDMVAREFLSLLDIEATRQMTWSSQKAHSQILRKKSGDRPNPY